MISYSKISKYRIYANIDNLLQTGQNDGDALVEMFRYIFMP